MYRLLLPYFAVCFFSLIFINMKNSYTEILLSESAQKEGAGEIQSSQPGKPLPCQPTPPAELGPFYEPNAPERMSVGTGHTLSGVVRSSADCSPIKGARIEIWLAGPDGKYSSDYRATLYSKKSGEYRFESHFPPSYSGRPPHIHIKIEARGYQTLITQFYPIKGQFDSKFDLVLVPISQ
ncbi:MAG: intradiol ring-cleavage dioxygenase [wastewater metagenome]|nr:intradiol ring-cleavage dioxygenase [Candidatus Loosdrechtia aerotolerans]